MLQEVSKEFQGVFNYDDLGKRSEKKNSGYNEFGTKGGGVSDLNHYLKQICNSEKGEGGLR